MTICIYCRKPGVHKECFDKLVGHKSAEGVEMKKECAHCPFKKGSVWMDPIRFIVNKKRIKKGIVQYCHKSHGRCACKGNQITLGGGSESCYTIEEFNNLTPCKTEEMSELYKLR